MCFLHQLTPLGEVEVTCPIGLVVAGPTPNPFEGVLGDLYLHVAVIPLRTHMHKTPPAGTRRLWWHLDYDNRSLLGRHILLQLTLFLFGLPR